MADKRSGNERVDPSLHDRVVDRIERFVDALDEAAVNLEPQTIQCLNETADKLMRAIARVLLEFGPSSELR
jgi:hypothetical protein